VTRSADLRNTLLCEALDAPIEDACGAMVFRSGTGRRGSYTASLRVVVLLEDSYARGSHLTAQNRTRLSLYLTRAAHDCVDLRNRHLFTARMPASG
jgi:hypothetical protein